MATASAACSAVLKPLWVHELCCALNVGPFRTTPRYPVLEFRDRNSFEVSITTACATGCLDSSGMVVRGKVRGDEKRKEKKEEKTLKKNKRKKKKRFMIQNLNFLAGP